MSHTPQLNAHDVDRLLTRAGWESDRCAGSHWQYKHPTAPGVVTVADHGARPLPGGTLRSVLTAAGMGHVLQQIKQGMPLKKIEKTLRFG